MRAFKLFRVRKDGSLGSLFINKRQRLPVGEWLDADFFPSSGFQPRKGWHTLQQPKAPHLSMRQRVWFEVVIQNYEIMMRPPNQGGVWYIAQRMKIIGPVVTEADL